MARISGVDLPREKRVEIGLTYIYGIGVTSSNRILSQAGVDPNTRVKDLTIAGSVIVRACPAAVRRPRQTQEPAKARERQLPTRRSNQAR